MRPRDWILGLTRALAREPTRVALTAAGIAVGTFAVALLVSLGTAIQHAITGSLRSLGENLVIVTPEARRVGGSSPTAASLARGTARLSEADASALRGLDTVESASSVLISSCLASNGTQAVRTTCIGVDADYLDVAHIGIAEGAELPGDAATVPRALAILGATVARRLQASPLSPDADLLLDGRRVHALGRARARGAGVGGVDEDDFVLLPKAWARQQLAAHDAPDEVDAIFALARRQPAASGTRGGIDHSGLADAVEDIEATLRRRRHVDTLGDTINVSSLASLMATSLQASDLLTLLLAGMASISVLVGGVGIVNVMLTSVAERRLEIGLKLALGASPPVIAGEFLLEATVLSLAGAIAGLGAAQLAAGLLGASRDLDVALTPAATAGALALALGVGVAAGAWPARRAVQLQPREILRDA